MFWTWTGQRFSVLLLLVLVWDNILPRTCLYPTIAHFLSILVFFFMHFYAFCTFCFCALCNTAPFARHFRCYKAGNCRKWLSPHHHHFQGGNLLLLFQTVTSTTTTLPGWADRQTMGHGHRHLGSFPPALHACSLPPAMLPAPARQLAAPACQHLLFTCTCPAAAIPSLLFPPPLPPLSLHPGGWDRKDRFCNALLMDGIPKILSSPSLSFLCLPTSLTDHCLTYHYLPLRRLLCACLCGFILHHTTYYIRQAGWTGTGLWAKLCDTTPLLLHCIVWHLHCAHAATPRAFACARFALCALLFATAWRALFHFCILLHTTLRLGDLSPSLSLSVS